MIKAQGLSIGQVCKDMKPVQLDDAPAKPAQDIRIELRRGATVVNVA